jgi:hypothetical protein
MARITTLLLAVTLALVCASVEAKVKIKVQRDKQFDFTTIRTYSWHPSGGGEVKVLQASTVSDDPEVLRAALDPVIRRAVEEGLNGRGLTLVPADQADVQVYYYLLVGAGVTSQHMGQFVGAVPEWGLPPFAGATTSLDVYEQGSLVLDLASPRQKSVIFRGTAAAEIDRRRDAASRNARVRDAIGDMLRKFPAVKK